MTYSDEHIERFRERWWHFGLCPRCWHRYSDWFTTRVAVRYCWLCAQSASVRDG